MGRQGGGCEGAAAWGAGERVPRYLHHAPRRHTLFSGVWRWKWKWTQAQALRVQEVRTLLGRRTHGREARLLDALASLTAQGALPPHPACMAPSAAYPTPAVRLFSTSVQHC